MFHESLVANSTRSELCAQESVCMLKRIERCCKFSDIFMARGGKVFLEGLVKDFIDALDTTPAGSNDLEDEVCCNEKKIEMLASLIEVAAGLHLEERARTHI